MDIKLINSKIVVIDDSNVIISKLDLFLKKQGYQVFSANNGTDGLKLVRSINPGLIILDLYMPGISGFDVCKEIRHCEETRFIPIIILSSSDSQNDKNLTISAGADGYINKSAFDPIELKLKAESLMKLKNAIDQLESANNIIFALSKATEVKDKYTVGHAERVSHYAVQIGKELKLSELQLSNLKLAGILHDIGKIGVPDTILNKPGKLDPEEFEVIKKHPVIGEEICSPIKSFDKVRKLIRHHHEKLNGKGYPDGISGDDIDIETRIMSVADIYDALTSSRSYRSAMSSSEAFKILWECVERGELDASIVEVFEGMELK